MGKFDVGDNVEWKGGVARVFSTTGDIVTIMKEDGYFTIVHNSMIKPILPKTSDAQGPIRKIRRRDIVPGIYGVVIVSDTQDVEGGIRLRIDRSLSGCNADELREAAHLFTQLAEFLDEEGK